MGNKTNAEATPSGALAQRQIRSDLERRGVSRDFSQPVAQRLSAIASDLSTAEYLAVLDGVAAAYGAQQDGTPPEEAPQVEELQRLVEGFGGELRKIEEGLQILSAYVVRMGRAAPSARTLH